MKKTRKHARTTLDADLAGYSAAATATLAKTGRRQTLKRVVGFGAATSAALLAGTGLEASIVYSGLQNIVLSPGGNGSASTGIDVDGGGDDFILVQNNFSTAFTTVTGTLTHTPSSSYAWTSQTLVVRSGNTTQAIAGLSGGLIATSGSRAKNFSSGAMVGTPQSELGEANTFGLINRGSSSFTQSGNFAASQAGFLGVQLGSGNFGWIQIHRQFQQLEIIDWAYDDSGAHIRAGAVPEPALLGLGLLSLGAAGVRELRRRKREAAEKVSELTL